MHKVPPEAEIRALTGHQFPGGHYTIAHWENVLLPGGLAHPAALFHLPIVGSGTSIAEMFALGQAESDLSIMIESYEWEFFQPLQEEREYRVEGHIASAERHRDSEREYDRIQFVFDVSAQDRAVARSTVTWHYTRNTL